MKNYYLIKSGISGTDSKDLAEIYLEKEITDNPFIIEPLMSAIAVLKGLSFDNNGELAGLKFKIDQNNRGYYCIEDTYYSNFLNQEVHYEIIKKLNSVQHVYEIRFKSQNNYMVEIRNCRIFITYKVGQYYIWTYGLTKLYDGDNNYYNDKTNTFGEISSLIFDAINRNFLEDKYVGKEESRHEVELFN